MKNLNLPAFYVGQRVVALRTLKSDRGRTGIVKGQEYIIKGISKPFCSCNNIQCIDVGVRVPYGYFAIRCRHCGTLDSFDTDTWVFSSSNFAPLQQQKFPLMTFSEIKVKEQEEILIDN